MNGGIDYPHLFSNGTEILSQKNVTFTKKALSIIGSEAFLEKGTLLDIPPFTGVYNQKDLLHYFTSLENVSLEEPIALKLTSRKHALTVGYDPLAKSWILIGANNIFARNYQKIEDLIENIEREFGGVAEFSDGRSVFSTTIYVMGQEGIASSWPAKIHSWEESAEYKKIHSLDSLSNKKKNAWLLSAILMGDPVNVERLLADKIEINRLFANGFSPLHLAAQEGHLEIVQALLKAHANVDILAPNNTSPLFIAAYAGHLEIVQALLQAHANPHIARRDRITPLAVAQHRGHVAIVEVLRNSAKQNKKNSFFK